MTPYEAVYGQALLVLLPYTPNSSQVQEVDMVLRNWDQILHILQDNLHMAINHISSKPINTILSAPFKSMIWFFFVCSLIINPPWNSKGIRSWLQSSMRHIKFFRRLGLLLINWNFLLLLAFTQYFMSLVSIKWLAPTSEHKLFYQN